MDTSLKFGWGLLEGKYQLPDSRDEHVVAVAEFAQAGPVVTENLKDFSEGRLPFGTTAQHPREFVLNMVSINPLLASHAVLAMSERSGRHGPKLDLVQYLESLVKPNVYTELMGAFQFSVRRLGHIVEREDSCRLQVL